MDEFDIDAQLDALVDVSLMYFVLVGNDQDSAVNVAHLAWAVLLSLCPTSQLMGS